jgi:hypothetical protein
VGLFPFGATPGMQRQAATPVAGFALVNGTPNIISWTAPNDGLLHRAMVFAAMCVTSGSITGGNVATGFTMPNGSAVSIGTFTGGQAFPGYVFSSFNPPPLMVQAGSVVTLAQNSALSAGTALVWAEIWGS